MKPLKKTPILKNKIVGQKNKAGRNALGKITIYHKGGGHKKKYRQIDFVRNTDAIGIVTSLEYDPFRKALIASIYDYLNCKYFYMLAPKNLTVGNIIKSGINADNKIGHCLPLRKIAIGTYIHNIALKKNKKAQLTRAPGAYSQIIQTTSKYCKIILSSGKQKLISSTCQATIGTVSNKLSFFSIKKKAGRNRWLNKRPTVRGTAMNPIDHPHGGGEGKSSGNRLTPWGKPNKIKKMHKSKY